MSESTSDFASELRISIELIIAVLLALGTLLVLISDDQSAAASAVKTGSLGVLLYVASATTWLLYSWRRRLGRWYAVLVLVAAVFLTNHWLEVPGTLALLGIPTAVAAALISTPAATAVAVSATALLVAVPPHAVVSASDATIVVALIGVWIPFGLMVAVYRPVYQRSRWLHEFFQQTQRLLVEARHRKAELEQALTDRAHANTQLGRANERMAALRSIAEDAQKTKASFVAKVSHEFRTPLNMIIGLVELMAETPEMYAVELSPEIKRDLEVVLRNCRHLSGMIDDVLDLTRIEAGRLMLHKERVDLGAIVDEAVGAVHPLVEKKGLSLEVFLPGDLPTVYCDRTRIRQVVLNLVSNAARFTEQGGISINVSGQDSVVRVCVTDTGPGIAAEDAERIFEPFSQAMSALWRDIGGSGLGLSVSQQFIRLHQGRLWLESEVGEGSSFFFELPISPPLQHVARPDHWIRDDWVWREDAFRTDRGRMTDQVRKPRIVICDAAGALHSELRRYLDAVDLVHADNPSEALQKMAECPADAVVLNVSALEDLLPVIDRARLEVPEVPIIGCCVPPAEAHARAAGAAGYLIKPVSRRELERAIRSAGRPVRRVLVVDDDPDTVGLFTRMLSVCDPTLSVETAVSGEDALDKLRRMSFDLLLLDVVLPDADGWEVLECLAEEKRLEDLSVFFVSAQDPTDRPPASRFLLATIGEGLTVTKLLRCSLELSKLLLTPDQALDLALLQTSEAESASRGTAPRPELAPALLP